MHGLLTVRMFTTVPEMQGGHHGASATRMHATQSGPANIAQRMLEQDVQQDLGVDLGQLGSDAVLMVRHCATSVAVCSRF